MARKTIRLKASHYVKSGDGVIMKPPGEKITVESESEAKRLIAQFGEFSQSAEIAAATKESTAALEAKKKELAQSQALIEQLRFLASLTDAEKAFYEPLSAQDKLAFQKLSPDERAAKITG